MYELNSHRLSVIRLLKFIYLYNRKAITLLLFSPKIKLVIKQVFMTLKSAQTNLRRVFKLIYFPFLYSNSKFRQFKIHIKRNRGISRQVLLID